MTLIKELKQSNNKYIAKISMLKIQDEKGNTLMHIIAEKGYHNFLKLILGYLYTCSSKNLENIKHDIKKILNIKNNESYTVLHTATIHNHKSFIKILFDHGYISKDNAEDAILVALEFTNYPANNAVKLLQEYIEKQYNSNDILEEIVQSTIVNQGNDLTEEDNNINHVANNGRTPCTVEGCKKDFVKRESLSQHIKIVHKGERTPCTVEGCKKNFYSRGNLYRHIKSVHNVIYFN
ncbi:C2H2-type zinc finger protein [Cardinium endosymbiont of Dermatophagoides farinae]|uniref:C2H2-type zinc finger protein n=1 Tax=Cardinium endosymbiont of Dermatophagoides farinae TaxID=2597823 RepID=UPI001190B50C|nr:C2H2-type zinc finger protein [Cardinium endosymbiont of Dermatophagoides farinae]TSJ80780.1 ankyrin repeat domain-containing protein [Cardinium endosymbiont of Dermatophagoides farinae]